MSDADIAAAYVRFYSGGTEADEWATERLNELAGKQPERAWEIIRSINAIPIENEGWRQSVHAVLGCGALEELIALHEDSMLPIILDAAKTDPVLRFELSTIYESSITPNTWSQICAVLERSAG